jgi:hypothetical protein
MSDTQIKKGSNNSKLSLLDTYIATNDLPLLPHYLCGYECRLVGSKSKLYVVRLDVYVNNIEQMPCTTSDGLAIVYIDPHTKMVDEEYDEYMFQPYEEVQECEWERVQAIIDENYEDLFVNHSNLVAINVEQVNSQVVVKFTVVCKGYIPYDESVLPKRICGAKTVIVEGWLSYCSKIFPGCDIAPKSCCYLQKCEEMEDEPSCTFGSIGGFVRTESKTYGVTAGHLFEGCELNTPVMHSTSLKQLYMKLKSHGVSALQFDSLKHYHGFKSGLGKACKMVDAKVEDFIEQVNSESSIQEFGYLVDFTTGTPKMSLNNIDCSVDIALIEVKTNDVEIETTDTSSTKYMSFTTGDQIESPQMILTVTNGKIEQDNIFDITSCSVGEEIEVHGMGARTSIDLYLKLRPMNKVYVRKWSKTFNTEPIFNTYHASSFNEKRNISIQPGDSGMWFWTKDKLVGMGIGYLEGNHQSKSIILPMKTVAETIEVMLGS